MQLLSEFSEEFGESKCLGWIPGKVKILKSNKKVCLIWDGILSSKIKKNLNY